MDKSIRVNVLGRDYALRVQEDNEAFMREVASRVDARMQAFLKAHPKQAKLTTAVIVALSLGEELYRLRREHEQGHHTTEADLDAMADRLAAALAEPARKETTNA